MINADLFKTIFGLYATEVWVKPEQDFLDWLNSPVQLTVPKSEIIDCISRQAALDAIKKLCDECDSEWCGDCRIKYPGKDAESILRNLPPAQPDIIRCKDCKYYKYGICMKIGTNKSFHGFCDWTERGEQE